MGSDITDKVWSLIEPPDPIPDDHTPHQGEPAGWQPRSLLTDELREALQGRESARTALSDARGDLAYGRAFGDAPQRLAELEEAVNAARLIEREWETHVALVRRRQDGMGAAPDAETQR